MGEKVGRGGGEGQRGEKVCVPSTLTHGHPAPFGQRVKGADATEAQMILNHKADVNERASLRMWGERGGAPSRTGPVMMSKPSSPEVATGHCISLRRKGAALHYL